MPTPELPPRWTSPDRLADIAALQKLERELQAEAARTDLDEVARASVEYHLRLTRANLTLLTQPDA